jgi:hypothetical protein
MGVCPEGIGGIGANCQPLIVPDQVSLEIAIPLISQVAGWGKGRGVHPLARLETRPMGGRVGEEDIDMPLGNADSCRANRGKGRISPSHGGLVIIRNLSEHLSLTARKVGHTSRCAPPGDSAPPAPATPAIRGREILDKAQCIGYTVLGTVGRPRHCAPAVPAGDGASGCGAGESAPGSEPGGRRFESSHSGPPPSRAANVTEDA